MTARPPTRILDHLGLVQVTTFIACLVAACAFGASRAGAVTGPSCVASATTVAPSCFEGGDGNLAPGAGHTDWDNTGAAKVALPDGSGPTDNMFSNGSKQQEPDGWSLITGEPNPSKSDVLRAAIATEQVAPLIVGQNQVFLYGAFQTAGDSGNTAINLELNQKQTKWTNSAGSVIPERTAGDVLVTYDGKGGAFTVGICKWVGNRQASGADDGWHQVNIATGLPTGTKLGGGDNCTPVPATVARGAASPVALNNSAGGLPGFPTTIAADTFAELTINLSAALAGAGGNQCFSFGSAWINTRSSDTVTSAMNDYVQPVNIPPTANCGVSVDKKVSTSANGPFTDSNTASASDDLYYELSVLNTGVVPLTITDADLTDANCSNLSSGPVRKENPVGTPDASTGTFDPGDVWTWTCNKTSLLGNFTPGGSYTNTVTAHAHFGNFTTPDATDSATTTFKGRPSLSTNASDGIVGGTISDEATLSGGSNPTGGSITFNVYGPSDPTCTTPLNANPITTTAAFTGNGTYTSNTFPPQSVGSFRWIATYSGDANNDAVSGTCGEGGETSTVDKATPVLATSATNGTAGGNIHDVATVTGGFAPLTGTVTFTVYQPGDTTCSGAGTQVGGAVNLSGGSATSANYATAGGAGDYRWIAHYSGNANNNSVDGPCNAPGETSTVGKATPNLATNATNAIAGGNIHDVATLSGGFAPVTGTVTFTVYQPGDTTCSGAGTQVGGAITISGGSATSADYATAGGAGSYRWIAHYSGDANNNSVDGVCNATHETSTVTKATPTLATAATDAITGGKIHDVATLTGGFAPVTGTVTFTVYQPGDTTCSGAGTAVGGAVNVSNGSATSADYTAASAGDYRWIASYSGDSNNNAVTGPCNAPGETSSVGKDTPTLATSATSKALGLAVHDTATLTGGSSPTGTITFTVYGPNDANCSGPGTVVGNPVTLAGGSAQSADFTPTQAGDYRWIASYSGDANNNDVTGPCNAPGETSTITAPALDIVKSGPAVAHQGDTLTFSFAVTNPGNVPIHNVVVTDDKCTNFSSTIDKKTGAAADASPATLDPGDTWTYTCSMSAPAGNSLTNVGTVKGDDPNGDPVKPDTSTHTTTLIHPALAIAKAGPGTATAGDTITFTLTVTNPGDVAFNAATVKVTDDKCPTAPALQSKTRGGGPDPSPGTLDPGDTWTYTCSVPTSAGQTSVVNTAKVEGTDQLGKTVAATGGATTQLNQPQQAVLAENIKSGVADFVSKPKKCVTKSFNLDVKGTAIAKVTFKIDGKKIKALAKPDAQGRFRLKVNPLLRNDKRHTVTAEVQYTAASKTAPKTLKVFFKRCACISRRAFTIRLRKQFHQGLKSATVFVNKKRVKVIRGAKRLKAPIKLVGLPKGRVTVKINAVTIGGKRVSGTRHYLTCNKKLKGGIPKL